MKEGQPKNFLERTGKIAFYGGLIAGAIGLILNPWLAIGGGFTAAGGEILRKAGTKKDG